MSRFKGGEKYYAVGDDGKRHLYTAKKGDRKPVTHKRKWHCRKHKPIRAFKTKGALLKHNKLHHPGHAKDKIVVKAIKVAKHILGEDTKKPSKRERQFKHIVESYVDKGYDFKEAERRAAIAVNKYRTKIAGKKGPKLITKGGSRHQWYPGKKTKDKVWRCLEHDKKFTSKSALERHYIRIH